MYHDKYLFLRVVVLTIRSMSVSTLGFLTDEAVSYVLILPTHFLQGISPRAMVR